MLAVACGLVFLGKLGVQFGQVLFPTLAGGDHSGVVAGVLGVAAGRKTSATWPDQTQTTYTYHEAGRPPGRPT